MTRMLGASTVFAAMAVLGVSPAMADDKVFHPPGICHGYDAQHDARLLQTVALGTYNFSDSQVALVVCGLMRDNTLNTNGLKGFRIRINVPTGGSGLVQCVLWSLDRDGNQVQGWRMASTTPGLQTLDWGTALNLSTAAGTYVLSCDLSPFASIRSIVMSEY